MPRADSLLRLILGYDATQPDVLRRALHHLLERWVLLYFVETSGHLGVELDRLSNDVAQVPDTVCGELVEQRVRLVIENELTSFGQVDLQDLESRTMER